MRPRRSRSFVLMAAFAVLSVAILVGDAWAAGEQDPENTAATKLAFVIGNTEYAHLTDLPNARNDAEDVSRKLRELGFLVVTGYNLTRESFLQILEENDEAIANAEAVLLFYAGHGFQFKSTNYLVPTSAEFRSAEGIEENSIRLDYIIRLLQDRNRPTLVFLDACRNNPMAGKGQAGFQDGLAQLEVGDSTFVAFATQPGNYTLDGTGRNSPFTTAFLEHVNRPGLSISDLMIEVRKTVETDTLGRQVPWDQSSLRQQFYFTESLQVDPKVLADNFTAILKNPDLREELRTRLVSADPNALHQFILLNSGSDPAKLARSTAPDEPVSAAVGAGSDQGLKGGVSSSLSNLLDLDSAATDKDEAKVLARRVQTELARLGCYRMSIDGIWGGGSKRSLANFYAATKQDATSLEPTIDVLTALFLETGRICKPPKVIARRSNDDTSSGGSSGRTGKKTGAGGSRSKSKPAVLPPDISAGIGVGGIF